MPGRLGRSRFRRSLTIAGSNGLTAFNKLLFRARRWPADLSRKRLQDRPGGYVADGGERPWGSCDRTGTADGICNDYAFAERPGRAPLLLSAYHAAPGMALEEQEGVLRDAARLVVAWQTPSR